MFMHSSFASASFSSEHFFTVVPDSVNPNRYKTYRSRVDMLLMKADLSPDAQTLTFTFTTPATLDKETQDFLQPYLREKIVYQWRDGRFAH